MSTNKDDSNNSMQTNQPPEPDTGQQVSDAGILRRAAGGVFSLGSSAVSYGFGTVRWAATTTIAVGSGALSKATNIVSNKNTKDKKE